MRLPQLFWGPKNWGPFVAVGALGCSLVSLVVNTALVLLPTGAWSWEGAMPPPQQIFSIFYFKRRILVDSDVLNVPVTRTRAWHTFTVISISLRVIRASMLE